MLHYKKTALRAYFMKKYSCFILFVFSFSVFGVEISSDLFISEDSGAKDTEEDMLEDTLSLSDPVVKKVYTKEKVVIKRDTSALDKEVKNLETGEKVAHSALDTSSKRAPNAVLDKNPQRKPFSRERDPSQSLDYGDYEIHWTKRSK